ncbi:MAG: PAS domain S-box protein, partial [Nitrospinaceae bacterium]
MGKSFFSTEARKYALYGVAFGFLFPLFGTFFEAWRLAGEVTRHSLFLVQSRNLLLWVIDTAPFWLGLFAWMAGKRQDIVVAQGRLLALEFGEADKARQLLDAQLSRILESSRDEIFLFRADDWKFIQANRGALNNLGYTEAEIRTLTPLVLFPELDRKTLAAHLRPLRLGEQKQISFETVEERKDGSQCPVEVRVHSAGEETPLLYTAMVLDISGRRQVQLLVQEERKKFFEILENLPIAFHLQAPDYSIPYANKMFRKRFGADTDQPCFSILYKRSGPGGTGTPFKVFDTGRQQSALRTAFDGRTYMTVRNPYTDVDGSPLIMEMAMDITEQEEAKQEAITARQVAEKANRAKSQFLARMSHELRTPLNAVLGFSQLLALEGEGRFTALDMEGLQMIGDAGKHLLDLVNEILDLSRIDAGKMK